MHIYESKADVKYKQHLLLLKTMYSLPNFLFFVPLQALFSLVLDRSGKIILQCCTTVVTFGFSRQKGPLLSVAITSGWLKNACTVICGRF